MDAPSDPAVVGDWRIERVSFDHPDASLLIEGVQQEYVSRYGGRDDTPLEAAYFDPPQGAFFVGYLAGEPVASGAWRRRTDVLVGTSSLTAEIKRMYVAASTRGLGLARAMLVHLEQTAQASGAEVMILETGLAQPEAIALYESAGYVEIPRFGFYKHAELARCYARTLEDPTSP